MAEEENKRSLHLLKAMFDGHTAIMLLIEPESGQIYKCNQSAADFYGYTQSELCALRIQDINALNPEKIKYLRMETASEGKRFFTFPHRLKSGEIKLVDVYSCPIIFDNMKLLFSIIFDATDRESAMKEIIYLSDHDYLTKVYNRKYFSEKYAKLDKMENYPLAVIVGDINGFKKITEENGFQIGDQVLTQFAAVLRKMIPPQGVLARISGDEFAIIIPRATESIVKTLTFQLEKEAIVETIKLVPDLCSSTLSAAFGYGIQLCVGDPLDSIMSEAETFMYRRKYYNNTSKRSQIVDAIMRALFEKSEREQKHSLRVSNISVKIAQALKLDDDTVSRVRVAGALHDIGKIGISENTLNKEGPLDQSEWKIMKQHPLKSARILTGADEYSEIVPIVKSHHERFDGSGYPDGLKGENIPLESRIICIADAYDAMTVERPYRKPLNKNEAILELNRCAGTQFDPEMIAVLSLQILE